MIPEQVDCIFFFNPFSVELLQSVLKRVADSYYVKNRNIKLFFYYPSDEYIACLMRNELITFVDEIDCTDLYDIIDDRERILIFEV